MEDTRFHYITQHYATHLQLHIPELTLYFHVQECAIYSGIYRASGGRVNAGLAPRVTPNLQVHLEQEAYFSVADRLQDEVEHLKQEKEVFSK